MLIYLIICGGPVVSCGTESSNHQGEGVPLDTCQGTQDYGLKSRDLYFHVNNFQDPVFFYDYPDWESLEGDRSLWCGSETGDGTWETPPGYGDNWDQSFASTRFNVVGDVTISFLLRVDTEPYDYFYIEYLHADGYWWWIDYYNGTYSGLVQATVPVAEHDGNLSFRLHFISDGFGSDEYWWPSNGAVVIDSLTISDDSGIIDYQDFESEAVGAQTTLDGHWFAATADHTSVDHDIHLPTGFSMLAAVPNPFNSQTTIAFDLPGEMTVILRVFDLAGRLVDVLLDGEVASQGRNEVVWRGRDSSGRQLPSGTYFYRLTAGSHSETRRMALVK